MVRPHPPYQDCLTGCVSGEIRDCEQCQQAMIDPAPHFAEPKVAEIRIDIRDVARCQGCKHWEQSTDTPNQWDLGGWCHRVNEPGARFKDGEGGFAGLNTAPDFGCVEWEAR